MKGSGCGRLAVFFVVCCCFFVKSYGDIDVVNIDEFLTGDTRNVKTLDPPKSGHVYSIFEGQSNKIRKMFEVTSSGVVTVRGPLLYTRGEANEYDVIVVQRPIGAKIGGNAKTLRIRVRDRNNFSPTFPKSIYYGFVQEGSPENTVVQGIGDCYAEDRDQLGIDKYSIVFGNEKGYFKIETRNLGTGDDNSRKFLVLKTTSTKIVRDPAAPNILLTVRAVDRTVSGDPVRDEETKILITIEDQNDNSPTFPNIPEVTINENTQIMTTVLTVRATDKDDGRNGGVYYYLNPLNDYFSVDPITGAVRVVRVLDWNINKKHDLTVYASDRGRSPRTGSKSFTIIINGNVQDYPPSYPTNVNPNSPPTFPDGPYNFKVREDFPVKAAVLIIRAVDRDREQLTYSLIGGSGDFSLNSRSGVLTLARPLDYESGRKVYNMEVEVRDSSGTPVKTKLVIEVQDVDENYNSPAFDENTIQKVASVQESKDIESAVVTVTATDADVTGSDGQIAYSVTGGTGVGVFGIDSSTGAVTTSTPLNRDLMSSYKLIINATDKAVFPRTTSMFLIIDVTDVDFNFPEFTKPMYVASVPEKMPPETFVTAVEAIDKDGQKVSYELLDTNFKIESTTGVIRTTRSLDAGSISSFQLDVIARTSGPERISHAQVNVTVTTEENAPPKFKKSSYSVKLPENQGGVSNLLCIAATDNNDAPVQYSITSGANSRINLDPDNGQLSTTDSFNYEAETGFRLRVSARKKSSTASQNSAPVTVDIDIQERIDAPKFQKDSYVVEVDEDLRLSTTVTNGFVIQDDDTPPDRFRCSLVNIMTKAALTTFNVVQSGDACKLVTLRTLDYSIANEFRFDVRATDKSFEYMFATTSVKVIVKDKNNHNPVFSQSSYWTSVSSNTVSGQSILTVEAEDKDFDKNAVITYSLVSSVDSSRFSLDGNSGILKAAASLEKNKKYQLQVSAKDSGDPKRESSVTVSVSVYDTAVDSIRFTNKPCQATLNENSAFGTSVLTVKSTGPGSAEYSIVGGDSEDRFAIISKSSGRITTNKPLDYEQTKVFKLAVRSKYKSTPEMADDLICTINIKDVDDQIPTFAFQSDPEPVTVESYTEADTNIIKALAFDSDSKSVVYSIDTAASTSSLPFTVDSVTGQVKTKEVIKYDRTSYVIVLKATDTAGHVATANLAVTVINMPEPPKFPQSVFTASVREVDKPGDTVKSIAATYSDPNNAEPFLKYSFISGNVDKAFCINRDGLITIARPLDREKVPKYTLEVMVEKGRWNRTAKVDVNIQDINDRAPQFTPYRYERERPENITIGSEIVRVTASDKDGGTNGQVTYSLLQPVDKRSGDIFEVKNTGAVVLKGELDYELLQEHILFIKAKDGGSPKSLSSVTEVRVKVQNVNDNLPVFSAKKYRAKVALDTPVKSKIIQLSATDQDYAGTNKQNFNFTIIEGNDEEAFEINHANGLITLKKSLATVSATQFELKVTVSDDDEKQSKEPAIVELNVYLPDGPPKFSESRVVVNVKEGIPANGRVALVRAATSEALTYTILEGNVNTMFKIESSSGAILATKTLDAEERKKYELLIRAQDTRDRSAQVTVVINVENINDNAPTIPDEVNNNLDRRVIGEIVIDDVVTSLEAYDKDGDSMTYKINAAAETYFYVDGKGLLRAKRALDDLGSTYLLTVTVEDDGSPPLKKEAKVRLVFVQYRPDQQPVRVDVSEDIRPGTKLARVPRVFPGGKLSIVFPSNSNFTIDSMGWIRNLDALDYEEKRFYSLTSQEVDSKGRKNNVDIEITVLDVNDNGPEFKLASTFASVNKNARSGAEVYKLSAVDKDSGSSGILGFQIISKSQPFAINPFTQIVESVNRFDHAKYNWTVRAFDFGIPRRMSDPVSIDIATTRIPPRFTESSYSFKVDEHSPTGTSIGRVLAASDSGLRIGYEIVEGNSGNKFRIDSQGQIYVNYILDFEKDPTVYNLKVRASELIRTDALKSEVDVKIELENVNDNVPKFDSLLYEKSIREDVPPGTSVLKVSAKDCDCSKLCDCSLGQLKYSLNDEFFAIDADSGIIRTKKELDYEKSKKHIFQVFVTDFGKKRKPYKEMCVVEVKVGNTNDNAPEFLQRDYSILVAEGATQNKALAAFQARDLDGDEVSYSISSGGTSPFQVNRKTGILTLTGTIPSDKTQYTLRIRAEDQDGKRGSDARVVIKIEDTNNHRPKFTNCNGGQVKVEVEENQPSLKIFQVRATDEDRGRNGEIEYGLEQWTGSLFKIDNTTGEIRTTAMLDREKALEKKSFKLFVWAQDGGHGSIPAERLISYCTVTVEKKDQNDNYPIFLTRTYDGSVYNRASIGTTILTVSASDEDEGANSKVQYTMQGSVYFRIDRTTGTITTKADLSTVTSALTETLTVTASNTQPMVGAPVQPPESKTNVQITISPNQPPRFQRATYTASVKEDVPLNEQVVTVKAVAQQNDPATGQPYPVIYNLIKANKIAAESFKIRSNGEISTAGKLNYESTKEFRLQVRAVVDGEDNRLYATALVIITVEDVNDDSPTFVVSNYQARVLENEAVGEKVITVEAEDLDTGAGGEVEYLLSGKNKDLFAISGSSGAITTRQSFDRETKKSYYVPFDAKDKGPDKQFSSNSYAIVTVVDQNDNKPLFNQSVYERTVKEDSPIGFSIMEVIASDNDIGENARLDYFITGVDGAVFGMKTVVKPRNYGLLTVEQPLDYETKQEYIFQVIATDRKDSASATIKIKINDANDNAPVFKRHAYEFTMDEETGPGVPVLKVTATDIDTSQVQRDKLIYSLDKDGLEYFAIDAETGQITTANKKIDREMSSVYFFTVKAFDGVNTGTARVKVLIRDINDNAPEFPNKPYVGYIMEGDEIDTSVLVVQAIDKDDPEVNGNTEITYSLDNDADGRFEIEPDSGLIKNLKVFDRETTPNTFIVVVRGTDKGNPKLSGTTEVKIVVLDKNDHAPVLTQTKYYANVPEDALPGYSVAKISVTDQDEGPNAEFEFYISDGSDPYRFYIDPRNGTVYVSGMLDFETQKSYLLNITVRDRGNPELTASERAYVFINIDDTNDNAPEFKPKEYNVSIFENVKKGKEFLTVTARDADSTTNSDLSFSITRGNDDDLFDIKTSPKDAKQGILFTVESLDREAIPFFELEITATDGGGLKGKGIVRITLLDINDNGPHFVPAWYEAKIKENLNAKQRVTKLSAYDPDEKTNGAPFVFSIINGTDSNKNFRLEEPTNVTSTMYSFGLFDREKKPEWKIGVRALDSGTFKMSNFTYVYVDVGDENDNEPFPGSTTILVNVYNKNNPGSFSGGIIGKPYYKDEDYDGDVNDYAMEKNKYFRVDPRSGDIRMQPRTPLGRYSFSVDITESTKRGKKRNGPNFPKTVTSSVTVIVRSVSNSDRMNSFTIQFLDMRKVGYFVVDYYDRFVSVMQSTFGVEAGNVVIFSIQKPKEETRVPATNVVLAIRKSGGGHFRVDEALTKIFENKADIERLGLKIGSIGIDQCAKEIQKVGKCRNEVLAYNNFTVASGDIGRVPAPSSSMTIVSVFVELAAVYESIIGPKGNCTPNPCLNGGTCHINLAVGDTSKGYVCECPENYRGPECQLTTRTFYGNSYIWLPKLDAYENSKIELEMSTKKADGLLLYQGPLLEGGNNGLKDFMAVVLAEGRLQVHISLGRTPVTLSMTKGPKLDDGEWHIIQVFRQLKVITIIIDKCQNAQVISKDGKLVEDTGNCLFQGSVKGQSVYLNGFGPLQIGGTENDLKYPAIPYTKFEGCIRNIKDNGRMYDLANPLKVVNAPVGCQLANKCPDCNGNGYCEPLWNQPSICVCNLGYSGTYCNARAKASYYLANSFTQYIVKSSKKRRELVPAPVPLKNEYYTNIALQVKVDANSSDCIVFLSTNSLGTEFNRVDVKNHILRYTFRLGNRMKTLKIPQINITDGKYHSVVIRREGNRASLQIDFDGKVEGNTGGSQRLLNIGGGSFFSGGLPNITVVQVVEAIVASGGNAIIRNPQGQVVASGTGIGSSSSSFRLITVGSHGNVFVSPTVVGNSIEYFVRAYTEHKADGSYVNHIGHHTHSKAEYIHLYNLNRGKSSNGFGTSTNYFTTSSDGVAAGGPVRNRGVIKSDTGVSAGGSGSGGTGTAVGSVSSTSLTGVAATHSANVGTYGGAIQHVLPVSAGTGTSTGSGTSTGAAAGSNEPISVIGDFGGCTAASSFNGVDLESDPSIEARRQNVVNGCPCDAEFCLHGGTCVNAVPSYCICPPGWEGQRCEKVSMGPNPGPRPATRFANPGVIAVVLVVLLAIIFIIGAVLLKRRPVPVKEVLVDDGHVHDNIRVYHDEGAGEEDNFGYDINQLMKYTYVENGGVGVTEGEALVGSGGGRRGGYGAGEAEITVAEEKPLLTSGADNKGMQHGVTTITRRRVIHPDSIDVGRFIDTRVIEANREYTLALDSIHIYKYEGDDDDVDDLSELGDSGDEDDDDDQDFQFLQDWGSKFDKLNRIFNED